MIDEKYKYSDLTGRIIKCTMAVHAELGNGFQEVVYQRASAIELDYAGISHLREFDMPVFYRQQQIATRLVDFFIEGIISVEIKALSGLDNSHIAQAINYLVAYNLEIGLLINFGEVGLKFKRFTNKKFKMHPK